MNPMDCICGSDFAGDEFIDISSVWCTTCTEAVVKTYFTLDLMTIIIEFSVEIYVDEFSFSDIYEFS